MTVWDHVIMPLGCDDNPLELHCITKKKKKVARVQWLECRRPRVFIVAALGHVCGAVVDQKAGD